ncbi:hypothetical protein HDU87_000388 [Geranomyces variabilis]|uniref:Arrestin C-terminal-like domain-containing protein n=1 Tax=Geranomyces variabilis TaxID=109894 RepID=A0AAD5TNL5_9FUNG|nr:hypothetical protein HDU87_000388 [Geranomyces variabilis]
MGAKQRIAIHTDGHLLFPGQTLQASCFSSGTPGQVSVSGCKAKYVKAVRLECIGAVHYKHKEKVELGEIKEHLHRADRSAVLLHHGVTLADAAAEGGRLEVDEITHPFSFVIQPSPGSAEAVSLPSSFSSRYVAIVYFLAVTVERKWKADVTCYRAFYVACWNDVRHTLYKQPLLQSRGIDVTLLGMISKGTIDARVSIPRGAYCKGETIPIHMQINHHGAVKRITGASVNLLRMVKWKRLNKGKEEPEPSQPVEGGEQCSEATAIRYKGLKIKPVGKVFQPLNIKPGQCNVDVTVDYYLDPMHKTEQKPANIFAAMAASTLLAPPPHPGPIPVALHQSDHFPWSSDPSVDSLVQISYELQVRLEIGSNDNRGSTAIRNASARRAVNQAMSAAPAEGPVAADGAVAATAQPGAVSSFMDGALSGGTKMLEFAFPVVIGTVAHGNDGPGSASAANTITPSAPPPPVEKDYPDNQRPVLGPRSSSFAASSPADAMSVNSSKHAEAETLPSSHRYHLVSWDTPSFPAQPHNVLDTKPLPSAPLLRSSSTPEPAHLTQQLLSSSSSSISSAPSPPIAPALTSAASFPPALPPRRVGNPVTAILSSAVSSGTPSMHEHEVLVSSSSLSLEAELAQPALGDIAPPPYTPI